ncbi:pantothenate transporter protein [Seiridium cupressi]
MGMAGATNLETLYVLRFFIGMLEASAYPGILTLLGNWYTPQELGKRASIFISSAMIAQMFSGYLQAALVGREPPGHLTWKTFREVFSMWPVYLFSTVFTAQVLGIRIYNYFTIYPKDVDYSIEESNLIPTAAFAFQAVLTLLYAWFSDPIQMRAPVI